MPSDPRSFCLNVRRALENNFARIAVFGYIEWFAAGDGRERMYVIDDDAGIRRALDHLFRSVGSSSLMRRR
jgi:hypothetical protein